MRRLLAVLVIAALLSVGEFSTATAQEAPALEAPMSVGRVPGERYQFGVASPASQSMTYRLVSVVSIPGLTAASATLVSLPGTRIQDISCARFTCVYDVSGTVVAGGRSTFELVVTNPQQLFGVATIVLYLDSQVQGTQQSTISTVMREDIKPIPDPSFHAELLLPENESSPGNEPTTWKIGAVGQGQYLLTTITVPKGLRFTVRTDVDMLYRVKEMADYTAFLVMLPEGVTQMSLNLFYPVVPGLEGKSIDLWTYFGDGATAEAHVTFK